MNRNNIDLLDYQIKHYKIIKDAIINYSRAIDASDTGTGKTYISLKLCLELNLIPFVICPKSMITTWKRLIDYINIKNYTVISYEKLYSSNNFIKQNDNNSEYKFTWDFDSNPKLKLPEKYLFIYDEAHKCKNIETLNSQIMLSLASNNVKILLLSATIIDKDGHFIPFGIVLKIFSDRFTGNLWINNIMKKHRKTNFLMAAHEELFNKYVSRMRISDTINIFKNNKIFFEGIEMENYWEIESKYDKIKQLLDKKKEPDNIKNTNIKNGTLSTISYLRMEIELLRVEKIVEMVKKFIKENKSVVIFVNFTDTIVKLSTLLDCKCIIWGDQTLKQRTESIDNFCSDKSRIILCNIQSGSAGISLHDTIGQYARVSIISPTWSAQNLLQSLGRIHRAMGKTDCEQYIIYSKGTIEESVGNIMKNKINNIRDFNDGNKSIKNENMDIILKNDIKNKIKIEESKNYIYKINDFDAIQIRISNFENNIFQLEDELTSYEPNTNNYNECSYRLKKVKDELEFNIQKLNETINLIINK